jgi:hypothetical protein
LSNWTSGRDRPGPPAAIIPPPVMSPPTAPTTMPITMAQITTTAV